MWITALQGAAAGMEATRRPPADPRLQAEAAEGIAKFLG